MTFHFDFCRRDSRNAGADGSLQRRPTARHAPLKGFRFQCAVAYGQRPAERNVPWRQVAFRVRRVPRGGTQAASPGSALKNNQESTMKLACLAAALAVAA